MVEKTSYGKYSVNVCVFFKWKKEMGGRYKDNAFDLVLEVGNVDIQIPITAIVDNITTQYLFTPAYFSKPVMEIPSSHGGDHLALGWAGLR